MDARRVIAVAFVGSAGLPLGCAQVLGVDVLPVYPAEGGASDGAKPSDAGSDACVTTPRRVTLAGTPSSAHTNELTFTRGPRYKLERRATHGNDASHDSESITLGVFEACAADAYDDHGQDHQAVDTEDAGLQSNWQYTYTLTVLNATDDQPNPDYDVLSITLWTWNAPSSPRADASASDTVTSLAP